MRNYRDRRSDFAQRRIDCGDLAVGYRAADAAVVALTGSYRTIRQTLDTARVARFTRLSAAMDSLDKDFDGSKCPRP
jgi:hypothetical protein